ncbi:MAG: hypothetical protein KGJ62_03970 [Armatimonadetes bacterium]|nr:hypothetical protein [Armatimonadota bacterium]MDE2207827.1 hypothetical protein [Armatimonadota bacterium]
MGPAGPLDSERVAAIYNAGIVVRLATLEPRSRSAADIETWYAGGYPLDAVEDRGEVTAFAAISTYRTTERYARVAQSRRI